MSEKHTPGPWEARRRKGAEYVSIIDSKSGPVGSAYGGNAEANARLMAAAPELMTTLEELAAAVLDGAGSPGRAAVLEMRLSEARAALARARGE